jgi:hypothetical protein
MDLHLRKALATNSSTTAHVLVVSVKGPSAKIHWHTTSHLFGPPKRCVS